MSERLQWPSLNRRLQVGVALVSLVAMLCLPSGFHAGFAQSGAVPSINANGSSYDAASGKLVIKGRNFQTGASVDLNNSLGLVNHGRIRVKGSKKIFVSDVAEADIKEWLDVRISNPDGGGSETVRLILAAAAGDLSADEVKIVIAQAVAQAESSGLKAAIAVTDKEGNVLGVFNMAWGACRNNYRHWEELCALWTRGSAGADRVCSGVESRYGSLSEQSGGTRSPRAPQASSCRSTSSARGFHARRTPLRRSVLAASLQ